MNPEPPVQSLVGVQTLCTAVPQEMEPRSSCFIVQLNVSNVKPSYVWFHWGPNPEPSDQYETFWCVLPLKLRMVVTLPCLALSLRHPESTTAFTYVMFELNYRCLPVVSLGWDPEWRSPFCRYFSEHLAALLFLESDTFHYCCRWELLRWNQFCLLLSSS